MNIWKFGLAVLAILLAAGIYLYQRPLPPVQASVSTIGSRGQSVSLPWPTYGQGALAEKDFGLLASHGEQKAVPMASTAKIVTALAIVKQKPLKIGEQGPIITISQADVDSYNSYYSRGGSVSKVAVGEQISQYQALQAMLIPSANNMANSLARWAFGSIDAYVTYANQMLADMKLKNTKVADASGFSADSVSTAEELVKLGEVLIENPVLAEIVGQASAELPVAGKVNNINWLLGSDGVIGIKTGSTDEAGGCFVFAAKREILDQDMTFIGAIMAAPTRNQVIADSRTIIRGLDSNFEKRTIAAKDQVVGSLSTAWGATAEVVLAEDFKAVVWKDKNIEVKTYIDNLTAPLKGGTQVGTIRFSIGNKSSSQLVVVKDDLKAPPWHWRLLR